MKASEVRKKKDDELRTELAKMQRDYFFRRFTSDPKRIESPGRYQVLRRDIARIKTVLRERTLARAASAAAVAAEATAEDNE